IHVGAVAERLEPHHIDSLELQQRRYPLSSERWYILLPGYHSRQGKNTLCRGSAGLGPRYWGVAAVSPPGRSLEHGRTRKKSRHGKAGKPKQPPINADERR